MKVSLVKKLVAIYKFLKQEIEDQKVKRQNLKRENLKNNYLQGNFSQKVREESIDQTHQSMKDSQGVSDFSGSSYNGPGNVDREKTNSNMGQRNF